MTDKLTYATAFYAINFLTKGKISRQSSVISLFHYTLKMKSFFIQQQRYCFITFEQFVPASITISWLCETVGLTSQLPALAIIHYTSQVFVHTWPRRTYNTVDSDGLTESGV